jgi:hypothetical protein
MSINYQFTLALKALREVQTELGHKTTEKQEQTLFPGLNDVLDEIGILPSDQLPLGIASDGLPLLLNLRDPAPGPLLILADQGSGKTHFLQVLTRAAIRLLSAEKTHYAVLTEFPDEWQDFQSAPHSLGISSIYDDSTSELLYKLACQAETGKTNYSTLVLFDGFHAVPYLEAAEQENLLYLLQYGPQAGIWPVVSMNAPHALKMPEWLSYFHSRIFGRIAHAEIASELTPLPGAGLDTLFPGAQFCLRQKAHWLRFWLPGL